MKNISLSSKSGALKFCFESDVVILEMDCPEKSVNTLSVSFLEDLHENLQKITTNPEVKGLVVASAKEKCFSAGADVSIFETMRTQKEAEESVKNLHTLFNMLDNAKFPVVAAIHGSCMGGGFELALACKYRVASNDPSTKLSLPETRLGVIPGGGGTQRLPRLVGLIPALDLILTARALDAKKALKAGAVHAVVPRNQLIPHAVAICLDRNLSSKYVNKPPSRLKYEANALGRAFIRKQTLKTIMKNTGGHYPAAIKAMDSVIYGINKSLAKGLDFEAKAFAECVMSFQSHSLVHLFRVITAAKKCPVAPEVVDAARAKWIEPLLSGTTSVGMLGAGLMGSGISTVLADKSIRSVLVDNNAAGLEKGMAKVKEHFNALVKKKRITRRDEELAVSRVSPSLSHSSFKNSPIVIEAVYEDLKIKQEMLKSLEKNIPGEFIFASNTSSLAISGMAAAAKDPGGVIGMHFFSPVPKMPLVEIIKTPQTRPEVLAATFELAQEMGKNIIVVNDGPAFYTTRVLGFLCAEALNILLEGSSIDAIDKAMTRFGWPVGTMALIDEVGIDVAGHVMETLSQHFGQRISAKFDIDIFLKDKRLGRKSGKGFYQYNEKKKQPDPVVYEMLKLHPSDTKISAADITERCLYVFIAESVRCLQEGILMAPDDGDLGAVFGLGFPPFLGGPFHYINATGKEKVQERMDALAKKHGARFAVKI